MTIVIPEELVPLLRDGLYFDLHGQIEEANGLIEPRNRAGDISTGVAGCLARAEAAQALLDVVGWFESIEAPTAVEVDVRRHRDALLRALLTRIASEHSVEEDPESATRTARERRHASTSSLTSSPKRRGAAYEHAENSLGRGRASGREQSAASEAARSNGQARAVRGGPGAVARARPRGPSAPRGARYDPVELACASGIGRTELEAIEAGRPYPGRRRARRRRW